LGHCELFSQVGRDDRERQTVGVVDAGRQEQQQRDDPAKLGDLHRNPKATTAMPSTRESPFDGLYSGVMSKFTLTASGSFAGAGRGRFCMPLPANRRGPRAVPSSDTATVIGPASRTCIGATFTTSSNWRAPPGCARTAVA